MEKIEKIEISLIFGEGDNKKEIKGQVRDYRGEVAYQEMRNIKFLGADHPTTIPGQIHIESLEVELSENGLEFCLYALKYSRDCQEIEIKLTENGKISKGRGFVSRSNMDISNGVYRVTFCMNQWLNLAI